MTDSASTHKPGCPRYSGVGECDCDTNEHGRGAASPCALCEAEQPMAQDGNYHDMGGGVRQVCTRKRAASTGEPPHDEGCDCEMCFYEARQSGKPDPKPGRAARFSEPAHKNTRGGNDYISCEDCGQEWDYRKPGTEPPVCKQFSEPSKCGVCGLDIYFVPPNEWAHVKGLRGHIAEPAAPKVEPHSFSHNHSAGTDYCPECARQETAPEPVAGTASAPQINWQDLYQRTEDALLALRVELGGQGYKTNALDHITAIRRQLKAGTPLVARCPKCGEHSLHMGRINDRVRIVCMNQECRILRFPENLDDFAQFFFNQPLRTPPAPQPGTNLNCTDCDRPKDDINFHFNAPGTNWGAALHWYKPPRERA